MKAMYNILTLSILILSLLQSQAQANDLNFTITSEGMMVLGETLPVLSTMTKTGNSITWEQNSKGHATTSVFEIQDSSGAWDEITGLGEQVYNMTLEGHNCTLTLKGEAQGISAKLSFLEFNNQEGDYSFNINTISYH